MYQGEGKLGFKPSGIAIKKTRETRGRTQKCLAQLVDLTPRSIMGSVTEFPISPFWGEIIEKDSLEE